MHDRRQPPVTARTLLVMAAPVMLASMSTPLVGAVDLAVLAPLGDTALLGGVAAANILLNFLFFSLNFLRSSTTGMTAQALGAGDTSEALAVPLRAIVIALTLGLLAIGLQLPAEHLGLGLMGLSDEIRAAAATYFSIRVWSAPMLLLTYCFTGWVLGRGEMHKGFALQLVLNLSNIALSIFFVWHLNWGLQGAAFATVCAETLTALFGAALLTAQLRPNWRRAFAAVPNWLAVRRMLLVNGDMVLRSLALIIVLASFTSIGASFGPDVMAANAVLMTVFYMSGAVMDGLATATQQLSGRFVGGRDAAGFKAAIALAAKFSAIATAIYVAVLLLGQDVLISTMSPNETVSELISTYYWWTLLIPIAGLLAFLMDGVFIGASWSRDLRNMMFASALIFFGLTATIIPLWHNHGLWIALVSFMASRGLLLALRLRHQMQTHF